MSSAFPGGLDNFTNPTASDTLDSATVPHADQHANVNDAIEAVQSTLGTNPQGSSATVKARLDALDTTVAGKASTTHAATHGVAGSDPVTVASSQVTGLATSATTDTTNAGNITSGTLSTTLGGTGVTTGLTVLNGANISNGTVANGKLANSSVTVNGSSVALGGSVTVTATPTNGTVTDGKIATAGLSQSSLNGVAITAWAASTSYTKGDLVQYLGIAYRRISTGTSRSTFDATEQALWQQVTPTPTSNGDANSLVVTDSNGNVSATRLTALYHDFSSTGSGTTTLIHGSGTATNTVELPLTAGTLVGTGDTGSVTSTMILDGTILNADINASAAIASSKLLTQRSPSAPVGSIEPIPRYYVSANVTARNNGYLPMMHFYADKDYSITTSSTIQFGVGVAASAGSGSGFISRGIILSYSGGTFTIIARTGNISQYYNSSGTLTNLGTTGLLNQTGIVRGTFDGSASLTEGTMYYVGLLQYASTLGSATFAGPACSPTLNNTGISIGSGPAMYAQYQPGTAADLAVNGTFSTVTTVNNGPYFRLTP